VLSRALASGRAAVEAGERSGAVLAQVMRDVVGTEEDLVHLDYAVAVDAATLDEVALVESPATVRLLIAAQVGPVRLIDNCAAFEDAAPTVPVTTDTDTDTDTPDVPAVHRAAARDRQLERIG
jgi:hypothetical protein